MYTINKTDFFEPEALSHFLERSCKKIQGYFKVELAEPEGTFEAHSVYLYQQPEFTLIMGMDDSLPRPKNFIAVQFPVGPQDDPLEQSFDVGPEGGDGVTVYLSYAGRAGYASQGRVEGAWIGRDHVEMPYLACSGRTEVGLPFIIASATAEIGLTLQGNPSSLSKTSFRHEKSVQEANEFGRGEEYSVTPRNYARATVIPEVNGMSEFVANVFRVTYRNDGTPWTVTVYQRDYDVGIKSDVGVLFSFRGNNPPTCYPLVGIGLYSAWPQKVSNFIINPREEMSFNFECSFKHYREAYRMEEGVVTIDLRTEQVHH